MRRAVSVPASGRRLATSTAAPSRAKARAMPRPMPLPAPVTIATLPARRPAGAGPVWGVVISGVTSGVDSGVISGSGPHDGAVPPAHRGPGAVDGVLGEGVPGRLRLVQVDAQARL